MALAIPFEEQLGANHTLLIDDESAWMRCAHRFPFGGLVANIVGLDGLALGIGEQREGDFQPGRGRLQDLGVIITDADDLDPGVLDRLEVTLQLDQLRAAERSPVGRAVEYQGRLALLEDLVQ